MLALSKAFGSKELGLAKKAIENGSETDVNLMVKIVGRLKRAAKPKPAKGTSTIPWKVAMALFAKRAGFTKEQTAKVLLETLTLSIGLGKDKQSELLKESGVGDALAMLDREVFSKLPPIHREGNISFAVECVEAVRTPMLVTSNDTPTLGEGEEVAK